MPYAPSDPVGPGWQHEQAARLDANAARQRTTAAPPSPAASRCGQRVDAAPAHRAAVRTRPSSRVRPSTSSTSRKTAPTAGPAPGPARRAPDRRRPAGRAPGRPPRGRRRRESARRVVRLERQQQRVTLVERVAEGAEVGRDARHQPVLLHQPLLEPAGVAGGQHLGEQHVRQVGGEVGDRVGHPVARGERRLRSKRIGLVAAPLGRRRRLAEVGALGHGARRDVAEVLLDQRAASRRRSTSPATVSTALPGA